MIHLTRAFAAAVGVVAILLTSPTFAAEAKPSSGLIHVDQGIDYAVPAESPFKFSKLEPEYLGVLFTGRVTLSGRYYYGKLDDYPGNDIIQVFFLPDPDDAKRLPRWSEDKAVAEMVLGNSEAFIKAVIPAKIAREVKRGRRHSVQGHVTIVAEGYEAVVSCGASIYVTRFVSVVRAPKLYAARNTVERTTC
jgi:hypothetical protein